MNWGVQPPGGVEPPPNPDNSNPGSICHAYSTKIFDSVQQPSFLTSHAPKRPLKILSHFPQNCKKYQSFLVYALSNYHTSSLLYCVLCFYLLLIVCYLAFWLSSIMQQYRAFDTAVTHSELQ